jgi:hypothetical protein
MAKMWPFDQINNPCFCNVKTLTTSLVMMGFSENIFWPILATIKCFSMMKSEMLDPFFL